MNLIDTFMSFIEMINVKFVIATVIMIAIFVIICYLLLLVVQSFQKRSEAINVKFPAIDDYGEIEKRNQFDSNREITVELVNSEDDIVNENVQVDDDVFLSTLSTESRQPISIEDEVELKMPEVGEIDYEKIKQEKEKEIESIRMERELANQERLRELAQADREEELELR